MKVAGRNLTLVLAKSLLIVRQKRRIQAVVCKHIFVVLVIFPHRGSDKASSLIYHSLLLCLKNLTPQR
jgi:hypothetical protein